MDVDRPVRTRPAAAVSAVDGGFLRPWRRDARRSRHASTSRALEAQPPREYSRHPAV